MSSFHSRYAWIKQQFHTQKTDIVDLISFEVLKISLFMLFLIILKLGKSVLSETLEIGEFVHTFYCRFLHPSHSAKMPWISSFLVFKCWRESDLPVLWQTLKKTKVMGGGCWLRVPRSSLQQSLPNSGNSPEVPWLFQSNSFSGYA